MNLCLTIQIILNQFFYSDSAQMFIKLSKTLNISNVHAMNDVSIMNILLLKAMLAKRIVLI